MSLEPLGERIRHQYETLSGLLFPDPNQLLVFLAEPAGVLDTVALLQGARDVAERLILVASDDAATSELSADREKTRSFFSIAMAAYPILQAELSVSPATTRVGAPFHEIAFWILSVTEKM